MENTANKEIRQAIANAELRHWQVAAAVGINRGTLCEWLRLPLTGERRARIIAAIKQLSGEVGVPVNG